MSLSLQQRIIESSNDLTNLTSTVATLTTDVAEAVAFHKNIIHDDANIKALADRATATAANISTLNSTTLAQQSEIDTITTNVASNAQAITDNNTYFQGKVDEELARAVAAEAALTAAISAEATRAEAAEVANADAIVSESNRAQAAEGTNATAIASEVGRATLAEGNLASSISSEEGRAIAAENVLSLSVSTESTRAQAAEVVNSNAIGAEVSRATGAEATITASLASEVSRATAAEAANSTAIASEISRATAAEAALTTDLAAEVSRATAAELIHTNDIAQLNTDLGTAVTTATAAIQLEETNRAQADEKMVFTHTLEFDGILSASSYPFCAGNGVPCEPDSAIIIPFGYKLVAVGFCRQSSELSVNIKFIVQHFDENSTVASELSNFIIGGSSKQTLYKVGPVEKPQGSITVKCDTVSGVSAYGRYRVSLYLQSVERFF